MTTIRTAVIGVGSMGRWHAQKFAALTESDLVAVVDADPDRAETIADEFDGVLAVTDYRELIGKVDAVALATPTSTHFEIAKLLLEYGVHLLIEKPIAATIEEARMLVEIAESRDLVLQVGHLERFNPAVSAIADQVVNPQFVESSRIAPYKPRSLNVSVVLDLMIHDIDLVQGLTGSPIVDIDAAGRSVFSDNVDVANARARFENGCVANITGSRISMKTERKLRIFQPDAYFSVDLHAKSVSIYRKRGSGPITGPEDIVAEKYDCEDTDALLVQARAFLASVNGGPPPLVDGRIATEALRTATIIGDLVKSEQPS